MSDLLDRVLGAVATAVVERITTGADVPATGATSVIEVAESRGDGLRFMLDGLRARLAGADPDARAAAVAEADAALRALYALLHPTTDCTDAAQWDIKAVRRRAPRRRGR